MSLRIGVNALYLLPGGVGGTEIYLRCLLGALAAIDDTNEYFVFVNRETDDALIPNAAKFHTVRCGVAATFRPGRIVYEQTVLCRMLRAHRIDVVFNPGYTSPLFAPCPTVSVFHDLQHKKHPEFFRYWDLPFWTFLLWLSARFSTRLIAVSDATAADLVTWLPRVKSKVRVIPHGTDPEFFRIGKTRRARPYILTASTLHPHKNVERLLESFALFHRRHPEYRLIVAGLRGYAASKVEARMVHLGLSDAVTLEGWVSRSKLYGLFESADAFIAPSLFEGFGMTVLEAMAAGLPLACSAIEPLQSLTGDVAHHFDPHSTEAMDAALERITQDEDFRDRAAVAGPDRARGYSWERAAECTLQELVSAVDRRVSRNTPSSAPPPSAT